MKSMVQAYSIRKLFWNQGHQKRSIDLTVPLDPVNLAVQFFPEDHMSATLIATNADKALDGIINWNDLGFEGQLTRIEYTVLGTPDGERVGVVHFHHDFKTNVVLMATRGGNGLIASMSGSLFIPYTMDVILDAKDFGTVQGVQFIA